jgi:hypothetical protein
MSKLIVDELRSGSIRLTDRDGVRVFTPNFQFDLAKNHMSEFSRSYHSSSLNSKSGTDWFPSIQYFMFHKLFWPYVLYQEVLFKILNHSGKVVFNKKGRVHLLYMLFRPKNRVDQLIFRIFSILERGLVYIHNRWILKPNDVLFFRYNLDDYRISNVFLDIKQKYSVTPAIGGGGKAVLWNFFNRNVFCVIVNRYFIFGGSNLEKVAKSLSISLISENKKQMNLYQRIFNNTEYEKLIGIDDVLFIFPLLYAAKANNIFSIGYQHGLYGKKAIGYTSEYCHNFEWFDNLVVWDDFWKSTFLNNNNKFLSQNIITDQNKRLKQNELKQNPNNHKILCMYESFLDIEEYVFFLRSFMKMGFKLIMKLRPGVNVGELKEYYSFTDDEFSNIEYCEYIDIELLNNISIIVGAKTGLLYEMLSSGRPVWIVETNYHILDEVINKQSVRVISRDDMKRVHLIYKESVALN